MDECEFYDRGERGYIAALCAEQGISPGTANACTQAGCATPFKSGACGLPECPRRQGVSDGG